jgi:hypothetical protein
MCTTILAVSLRPDVMPLFRCERVGPAGIRGLGDSLDIEDRTVLLFTEWYLRVQWHKEAQEELTKLDLKQDFAPEEEVDILTGSSLARVFVKVGISEMSRDRKPPGEPVGLIEMFIEQTRLL